jgi:hypothetical protein
VTLLHRFRRALAIELRVIADRLHERPPTRTPMPKEPPPGFGVPERACPPAPPPTPGVGLPETHGGRRRRG